MDCGETTWSGRRNMLGSDTAILFDTSLVILVPFWLQGFNSNVVAERFNADISNVHNPARRRPSRNRELCSRFLNISYLPVSTAASVSAAKLLSAAMREFAASLSRR